jgi:hypothetical protein
MMGIRTNDELERTRQRLALVERRLERLEALVREKTDPSTARQPEASSGGKRAQLSPGSADDELRFPEIQLQVVETPSAPPARDCRSRVSDVRAAIEAYPHLIQPLNTLWGHPEFDRFVSRLIVDDRGGRHGFSPDVMEELLFLAQLNHQFCPSWHPRDPWEDAQFIGDRM